MKLGIALAICISVIMVGSAFGLKKNADSPKEAVLVTKEFAASSTDPYYEDLFAGFSNSTTSKPTIEEPVTGTDLVARQLMIDYLGLAENGEATPANLNLLAKKYIDSIPTLLSVTKLSYLDLKIESDSQSNFKKYSEEIQKIYTNYASGMLGAYSSDALTLGPQNSKMSKSMSDLYLNTFKSLKEISVPASLVEAHLALANVYLENAAAMDYLSQASADPASAFAGIISINNNLGKEEEALREIEMVLTENGV